MFKLLIQDTVVKKTLSALIAGALLVSGLPAFAAGEPAPARLDEAVNQTIRPLMQAYAVPGMAIGVSYGGKHYFYNFGLAAKDGAVPVTQRTLFELGSISKTFAATLAAYGQASGAFSLNDNASRFLPALAGSRFDAISLLQLGTYTAGGLPLQFPDEVDNQEKMVSYYRNWRPEYAPGTYRQYSNPSLGLFGFLAAKAMNGSYASLVTEHVLQPLGMQHTVFSVTPAQMPFYAWGYSKQDKPIRVSPGVLDEEAYGLKSSAEDMLRYVDANMNAATLSETMQQAIRTTQTGYFRLGEMTQGLGWELYPWPVTQEQLLAGNSAQVAYQANKVTALTPPQPPARDRLVNKTGSTNGFGAYVAFIPGQQTSVVLLANKNYPNDARIKAALQILNSLEENPAP